jgi:hypothetical protein
VKRNVGDDIFLLMSHDIDILVNAELPLDDLARELFENLDDFVPER